MEKCDSRNKAYKNGRTFDQCREIANKLSLELQERIQKTGQLSWDAILEGEQHDELVYKLTLKYLRQSGYDIGDWKKPLVTKITR